MEKKKLVLLSGDFPYGNAGDNVFIRNEIDVLAEHFSEIKVISTSRCDQLNDLPENVSAVQKDIRKFHFSPMLLSFINFFSFRTIREMRYAKHQLGFSYSLSMLTAIFKYYYTANCLKGLIKKEMDGKKETIVYSYWLSSRAFAASELKRKGFKIKVLSKCHRYDCYISENYLPFRKELNQYLDAICFISEDGKTSYEKNILPTIKNAKAKLLLNRLGVNITLDHAKEGKETAIKRVVSCSNIIPIKRIDIIINALALITQYEIEWIHWGDGPQRAEMEQLAKEQLLEKPNIKYYFAGAKKNCEILEYYRNNDVDLFLNSSDSEGIPVSIMEAFAFSIPAIARDVGGIREIMKGEFLLSSTADAELFAQSIVSYLDKTLDEKNEIKRQVYEIFVTGFNAEVQNKKFVEQLYAL